MALAVFHSAEEWIARGGAECKPVVVTIGNFDGVHRGHQEILRRVVERASKHGSLGAVLTFDPHPARVLRPAAAPRLLTTLEQRLRAFDKAGLNAALVMRFDGEVAKISAEDFVRRFLVDAMRAQAV